MPTEPSEEIRTVEVRVPVIRLRKLDKADFQEQEAILDLYLTAMDMR